MYSLPTTNTEALSRLVATAYNLEVKEFYLHSEGVSFVYLVKTAGNKYVFKLHRPGYRTLQELQSETELLAILQQRGARVSGSLPDIAGSHVITIKNLDRIRYGILYTFAPGSVQPDMTEEQLTIVGREMAFNHTITSGLRLETERYAYNVETTLVRPMETLKEAFATYQCTDKFSVIQCIAEKTAGHLQKLNTAGYSHGYCHYDYLPKNFHFTEDNEFTLFDFDFFGRGFLVNDLMSLRVHYFYHMLYKNMSNTEAERLFAHAVAGYRQKRALPEEELQLIPYLGHAFFLFYLQFHYRSREGFSKAHFDAVFFRRWLGWIEQWEALFF